MDNYFKMYKYTGIAGLKTELKDQIVGLKSIDRAIYDDYQDALKYPTYAPYSSPVSYSCESWIKIEITGNNMFNRFSNLSVKIDSQSDGSWGLFAGITDKYSRPTNSKSFIATTECPYTFNAFDSTIAYPVSPKDSIISSFIVIQLEVYTQSKIQPVGVPVTVMCDKYCVKTGVIDVYTEGVVGITPTTPSKPNVMLKSAVDILGY